MKVILLPVFFCFCLLISGKLYAQMYPLSLMLGAAKTEVGSAAMRLAVDYCEKNFQNYLFIPPDSGTLKDSRLFTITPEVKLETGEKDIFSGIIAKASGNLISFKDTVIAGVSHIPDPLRTFFVFPVSAGIETDNTFKNISALLEAGLVPWYQAAQKHLLF